MIMAVGIEAGIQVKSSRRRPESIPLTRDDAAGHNASRGPGIFGAGAPNFLRLQGSIRRYEESVSCIASALRSDC